VADNVMSNFLVKIAFDQDERSRKKFDEGLKQVQTRAAEFGAKIGELPTIVSEATKRISSSLTELWYASQKTGASAEQIDALRRAATQSGEGADNAERAWNGFSETLRKFGDAAGRQLKAIFDIDYNPNDKFGAFLRAREKFSKEYNEATDKEGKGRALAKAEVFSLDEESAVKGRQEIFNNYIEKQLKRNSGLEAEKAAALTRAYNALADALETVARKADAAVFDKFSGVLDRLTRWLDDEDAQNRIVKFFTDLATQIGLVFEDLKKLKPAFVLLWDALKEVGSWLEKIIGNPDSSGLAGVRHLLEFISGVVMARFVAGMVAGFVAAFAPLTALLAGLAALGVISVGAYTAGEAVRDWFGGRGASGGGFGAGEGMEGGGHGAARRNRFGHGGGHAGDGTGSPGKPNANFTAENAKALRESAARIGTTPEDLATVIGYETEGSYSPSKWGGAGGRYMGLIQFGPPERAQYGANENQSFKEQLGAVERYLIDRGYKSGMPLRELYSTIVAGRPGLNRADSGGTVNQHVERMKGAMAARGRMFLRSGESSAAAPSLQGVIPGQGDPHKPGFDPSSVKFHDYFPGKPLGTERHSMNEIHDHRSVDNDVNIHVSASPVDRTASPLGRPRNADLIRNTTSYAS